MEFMLGFGGSRHLSVVSETGDFCAKLQQVLR